jgi:hypothetical protein
MPKLLLFQPLVFQRWRQIRLTALGILVVLTIMACQYPTWFSSTSSGAAQQPSPDVSHSEHQPMMVFAMAILIKQASLLFHRSI